MTTASTAPTTAPADTTDPLMLVDVDHVRFYVGNAKQAAFFYAYTFGFQIEEFSDLTTGSREQASYLLTQGNIRMLLTSGLTPDHPAQDEVRKYGDGVKDVALTVFDAEKAYERAIANGGASAYEPRTYSDEHGTVTMAGIQTYGRCVHSLVSRTGVYELPNVKKGGLFMPGFRKTNGYTINDYNKKHRLLVFRFVGRFF